EWCSARVARLGSPPSRTPPPTTVLRPVVTRHPRILAAFAALVLLALIPTSAAAETGGAGQVEPGANVSNTAFDRQGMWVWYVSHSEGGSIGAIIARAKANDIGTVYVKAGDGGGAWSQFSRGLVQALHRSGLDVCAWQFVYGDAPLAEARVAAGAVAKGADCFVIDAEADYEGKYAAAETYVRALRARIGATFPVALAGFPYVDYHPSFPYSVFFGPGGAQYNQPQMYWKTIGTSVRTVFEHTYLYNRIWGHPIYPIGQTYEGPGAASIRLFRRFAQSYGGLPPSWWDWQETSGQEWGALGAASALQPVPGYRLEVVHPLLKRGSKGDMVVWAQEHLAAAAAEVPVTGVFGRQTARAVHLFKEQHGLPANALVDTDTWNALLAFTPVRGGWAAKRARPEARPRSATRPRSASLPAKAYEIPPRKVVVP
ncbi:MAG TPA: peptidoglycan-binding domain-containing protein, partial [Solirubrobacterales bacterium]|nr:peptidoglycan-binding domain-containing protein [Solirubrobacterales bacterium]